MDSSKRIPGIWWLSDKPENHIAGDLLIEDRMLELNGSFEEMKSRTFGGSFGVISVHQDKTIQGIAKKGGKKYTLEYFDEPSSITISMPGYRADTYMLGNIFEGDHFEKTGDLSFERYYIEFPYLFEWVGGSVINSQMTLLESNRIGNTTITVNNPMTVDVFKNDDFKLSFVITPRGVKIGGEVKEMRLSQDCTIKIESIKSNLSLQDAGSIIAHFERFLTIAVGRSLELIKYQASSGKGKDSSTVNITLRSRREKRITSIHLHNMNFTFADIKDDGQTIFEKWFSDRDKYADVFNLLSSIRSDTGKNLNNQFKDVVSAIDGYYGIEIGTFSSNRVDEAIKHFNEQLPNKNKLLSTKERKQIRITRNKLSHVTIKPEEEKFVLDNEGMWFNFQKMLFLLEYVLLKSLGTSEDTLGKFYTKRKNWN